MGIFVVSLLLLPVGWVLQEKPELLTNHFYHWLFNKPYDDEVEDDNKD
jgi:hypothetical protein